MPPTRVTGAYGGGRAFAYDATYPDIVAHHRFVAAARSEAADVASRSYRDPLLVIAGGPRLYEALGFAVADIVAVWGHGASECDLVGVGAV